MPAIANIVAFDGAATPTSHTFFPEDVSRDAKSQETIASWKEALSGVPDLAQGRIRLTRKVTKQGVNVVKLRVQLPIQEAISGQNSAGYTAAQKVAHIPTIEITGYFHPRSTMAERKMIRYLAAHIMQGNSATEATSQTGPNADANDVLVMPT